MRVRWTTDAADDLERICDYIAQSRPESARRVAQSIVQGVAALESFPNLGRPGRVEGTRELVFVPLPFVAIYEVHTRVTAELAGRRLLLQVAIPGFTPDCASLCISMCIFSSRDTVLLASVLSATPRE